MKRLLDYKNTGFREEFPCVFISNDMQWDKKNDCAEISKWISDYKRCNHTQVTTFFAPIKNNKNNRIPWHPLYVNRYVSASRLFENLKNDTITFLSPSLWDDPFERLFYNKELVIDGKTYDIRCICATYDYVYNEEAAWNRSDNKEDTIRVSFNFEEFCSILSNIGKKEACNFYISFADYSQSKDNLIIKNIKTPYKSIGDYIKVMSLKRKAFAYENEMRIFAVIEKSYLTKEETNGVLNFKLKPNDYSKMINHVTLPPMKHVKDAVFNSDILQIAKNSPLETKLRHFMPKLTIHQSRLYWP